MLLVMDIGDNFRLIIGGGLTLMFLIMGIFGGLYRYCGYDYFGAMLFFGLKGYTLYALTALRAIGKGGGAS